MDGNVSTPTHSPFGDKFDKLHNKVALYTTEGEMNTREVKKGKRRINSAKKIEVRSKNKIFFNFNELMITFCE